MFPLFAAMRSLFLIISLFGFLSLKAPQVDPPRRSVFFSVKTSEEAHCDASLGGNVGKMDLNFFFREDEVDPFLELVKIE